jgi:MFS family permease
MESNEMDELPGTLRLLDEGKIVLSPPPTNSANDPLNWSNMRKYWHAFLVCFITGLTAATSNDASSAQFGENEELGTSYGAMNTGAGVLFIGIGYGTLFLSPAAWLWGRKSTYLFCLTMGVVGAIWMARTQTTADSIWNQLFVGISEACAEANVQLSLSDLFHEHQRGRFIGVYVLATSIGTYLGPLIAGYIADSSFDWRWIGWWSVIISGGTILVCLFTLEETMFDRPAYVDAEMVHNRSSVSVSGEPERGLNELKARPPAFVDEHSNTPTVSHDPPVDKPMSYLERIAFITPAPNLVGFGFKQYATRLWHTLRIFSFPGVIFSGVQWGAQDAWLTFYITTEDDTWSGPPWNYGDVGVGLMNVPCLIGAVLGCFYGGYLSDKFVIWMARRNGGIQEAEHRLWLMLPLIVINPLGMLLFGIGTGYGWPWPGPYIGLGLIGFGWGCTGDLSMSYLMDAYPEMVLEGMVGVSVINNSIACIFTFTASMWLDAQGPQNTFIVIAALDFFIVLTTVPMMILGKRCRRWTKRRYLDFVRIRDSL